MNEIAVHSETCLVSLAYVNVNVFFFTLKKTITLIDGLPAT